MLTDWTSELTILIGEIHLSKVKRLALPFLTNFVTSRRSCCLCEPRAISILLKRDYWSSQKLSFSTMVTEQL